MTYVLPRLSIFFLSLIAGIPGISNQIFKPQTAAPSKSNKKVSHEIIVLDDDEEEDKIESASPAECNNYIYNIIGDGKATKENVDNDVPNVLSDENVIETNEILRKINNFDLHSDLFSSESEDEERDVDTATNDEVKKINSNAVDKNAEQKDKIDSSSPEEFKENLSNVTTTCTSSDENVIEAIQDTELIAEQEKDNSNITTDKEAKKDAKVSEPDQNKDSESEDFDIPSDDLFGFESEDEAFDDDTTDNEVKKPNSNAVDKKVKPEGDKIRRKKSTDITEEDKLRAERNKDRVCTCGYTRELKEKVEIKREGSWKVYFKKKVFYSYTIIF